MQICPKCKVLNDCIRTYKQYNGRLVPGYPLVTEFNKYRSDQEPADLTQAGDMNYLLPHLALDVAPLPTVNVPLGHGIQLVFIA